MYTHRKFDSQNGHFEPRKQLYGNQISRGIVEGKYIIHIGHDSQNGHFEPESSFTGIKFQEVVKLLSGLEMAVLGIKFPMCIHSPSTIPLEI